jgi:hypothetical protein
LLEKGVVVREGGANLLIKRVGRTLQQARKLNPEMFRQIDQRETQMIIVPDTTKRYRLVSRQNLDHAKVDERDGTTFRGNLKIEENIPSVLDIGPNSIAQNMQVFKNRGTGPKAIANNTVGQNLQCFENQAPFVGGPNTAQKAEGQCF